MTGFQMWFHRLSREKEDHHSDVWLPDPPTRPEGLSSFAEGHNDASLAMYRQFLQKRGNLFFSPFSIRTVLAMSFSGARGETADQMRETLHFPSSDETMHIAFAEIVQRLSAAGSGKEKITVANSLWGQDGEPFQPGFLDLIARYYEDGMHLVDFRSDAEAARVAINRWVDNQTKQKIQELIPSGGLGVDARLVLVNAVHFMGKWSLKFRRELTRDQYFYLEDGGKVTAPLMVQIDEIQYMNGPGFQAVDLGYQGGDLSMLVILPANKDGLRDLESKLSARNLFDCVAQMRAQNVMLFLPRFRMTWGTFNLGEKLAALGLRLPFTPFKADFSGINGFEPPHVESLHISSVFHKAFVDVNEEGTEAAAATGVGMVSGYPDKKPPTPTVFMADHPFLFAIRDRKTGAILFLGRVADPTREN